MTWPYRFAPHTPPAWDEGIDVITTILDRPEEPPVSQAVVIEHLRLSQATGALADGILRMTKAAWSEAELVTQRALTRQTRQLQLSAWPCYGAVVFPAPPFVEVANSGITYRDADGATQIWGGSPPPYQTDGSLARVARGRLAPNPGETWPVLGCGYLSPITIPYVCGYAAGAVPEDIIAGILLMVGELFKLRTESVQGVAHTVAYRTARSQWEGGRA
jgi:uncharacterized phiE125 gp8 family phage protein